MKLEIHCHLSTPNPGFSACGPYKKQKWKRKKIDEKKVISICQELASSNFRFCHKRKTWVPVVTHLLVSSSFGCQLTLGLEHVIKLVLNFDVADQVVLDCLDFQQPVPANRNCDTISFNYRCQRARLENPRLLNIFQNLLLVKKKQFSCKHSAYIVVQYWQIVTSRMYWKGNMHKLYISMYI